MIHPMHNVLCLFLILLISFSDVAASIVAEEINAGVTVFVAEITSSSVVRCCFTALLHFVLSATMYSQDIVSMSTAFISGMHTSL